MFGKSAVNGVYNWIKYLIVSNSQSVWKNPELYDHRNSRNMYSNYHKVLKKLEGIIKFVTIYI